MLPNLPDKKTIKVVLALGIFCTITQPAIAEITLTNIGTLGGSESAATAISVNNSVIVGRATNVAGQFRAFRWEAGVMTDLGTLGGGSDSRAQGTSADGSVVVGRATNVAGQLRAFRWEAGVMTDLGTLGGNVGVANAVSANGAVIVGYAQNALGRNRAFRWEAGVMTDLGTVGGNAALAIGVSDDGSVVVGYSRNAANEFRAFRWEGGIMADLGTLGGNLSISYGTSSDGSVITGHSTNAAGHDRAFRWEGGLMADLGTLGGNRSYANQISADGRFIVGRAELPSGNFHATLWDQGAITDLNTLAPNLTGWSYLEQAFDVSDDGKLIVGQGVTAGGENNAFLLNLAAAAVVTPEQLVQDLAPAVVPANQSRQALGSQIGNSLTVARNAALYFPAATQTRSTAVTPPPADIEPAAGGSDVWNDLAHERRHAFYAVGSYGLGQNNIDFSSTTGSLNTGILVKPAEHVTFGAGIIGTRSRLATNHGGESRVTAKGGTMLAGYAPPSGWSLYASAAFATLDAEIDRRYLSGGAVDASTAKTEGVTYGGVARLGYTYPVTQTTAIMPYAEAEVTRSTLDAYTETSGAFPAAFDEQSGTEAVSRIGAELSHAATPDLTLRARAAWGHRYGDPDNIAAKAATLSVTLPAAAGDRNWAEAGVSANWSINANMLLSADLSFRSGETTAPAVSLATALVIPF